MDDGGGGSRRVWYGRQAQPFVFTQALPTHTHTGAHYGPPAHALLHQLQEIHLSSVIALMQFNISVLPLLYLPPAFSIHDLTEGRLHPAAEHFRKILLQRTDQKQW